MNQQQDNKLLYVLMAIAAFAFWRFGKSSGSKVVPSAGGCTSSAQDQDVEAWAGDLKNMFQSNWFWSTDDYDAAIAILNNLPDVCAARKLYDYFGSLSTIMYGTGDLDYWLSDWPESWKDKARTYLYGVGSF